MFLSAVLIACLWAGQQVNPAPSLPSLALRGLPEPTRSELQRAYEAAATDPNDAQKVGALGMLLHAHEQYGSAERSYRIARSLEPRSLRWVYLMGVVQTEVGDDAGAINSLRDSLAIDPDYVSARARLADVLLRTAELEASRELYTALTREFPGLPTAHYGLGLVAAAQGDKRAAAAHHRHAIDVAPQFGAAHYALALAYRDTGRHDLAERHLRAHQRWGARVPVLPDPLLEAVRSLKSTARDLIGEAARLAGSGRFEESIALHLKALEADPTVAQAHVNLISLYGRVGQLDKAAEHYRSALTLERNLADAHYNYGVLLAATGRSSDAAESFRRALEVNPLHAQAHNNLAALFAAEGRLEEAASHYRQAVTHDPAHRAARLNLGRTLVGLGRPSEGIAQLEWLLRREDADTPRVRYALAHAWLAANDIPKARRYGEDAVARARALGQTELADRMARELVGLDTVAR